MRVKAQMTEIEQLDAEVVRGLSWAPERCKMFAFLSIMHPNLPLEIRLELANDCERNKNGSKNCS
jgi:hypothetical protein